MDFDGFRPRDLGFDQQKYSKHGKRTTQTGIVSKCVAHTCPITGLNNPNSACQHTMLFTQNADLLDLLDLLVPMAGSNLQLPDQLWQVLLLSLIGSEIQQLPEVGCVHV